VMLAGSRTISVRPIALPSNTDLSSARITNDRTV
jgi:hypothetical protein